MIRYEKKFVSNPHARSFFVTKPMLIRCTRPGLVEVTFGRAKPNARHILRFEEVVTLRWPIEAMLEAQAAFHETVPVLMQRDIIN